MLPNPSSVWHRFVPDRDLMDVLAEFFSTHPTVIHRLRWLEGLERTMDAAHGVPAS